MKRILYFFLLVCVMVSLNGCRFDGGQNESISYRVAAILPQNNKIRATDFWKEVWNGVHDGADSFGFELSEYSSDSVSGILERVEIALLAKVEGMILFTSDSANKELLALVNTARRSGVKVVIVDTDIGEENYDAFVGIDNEEAGRQLAAYLMQSYQEGQEILALNPEASGAVEKRKDAFLSFLEEKGLQDHVLTVSLQEENEERLLDMQQALDRAEKVKWMVSFDPSCTIQAAETLSRLKLAPELSLIGFGESDSAEEYMENQIISALLVQDNYNMGLLATEKMKKLLDGEELKEKQYYVDSRLLTSRESKDIENE